jgi:hypothetical protein
MTACVIMHNMIVEVERDDSLFDNEWDGQGELVTPQGGPISFQDILHVHHEIRDLTVHNQLQANLVEHMWQHVGNNAANNNEGNLKPRAFVSFLHFFLNNTLSLNTWLCNKSWVFKLIYFFLWFIMLL